MRSINDIREDLNSSNNWRIIDLSHNLIEFDANNSDVLRNQTDLETIRLNFNRNFTAGNRNQQIFVNGNLKIFECSGCGFEDLESEYFTGFGNLLELHLDENGIRKIHVNSFKANKNLSLLSLIRNKIETLPQELFAELKNFESLLLSENPITVPENSPLFKSDSIKLILLDNCNLTVIYSETFSQLASLQNLSLSQNLISTLPANSFAANKNLKSLFMEDNRIKTFPISILFEKSSQLSELCIDKNQFEMKEKDFDIFTQKYTNLSMRSDNCQKNASLFFQNIPKNYGIPKLFIGSYLTLVIICQAIAFVLLTFYYIKISKYERLEGDVNYSNTILNDDDVYKVFKLNDEWKIKKFASD